MLKPQVELWDDGVRAGAVLKNPGLNETTEEEVADKESDDSARKRQSCLDSDIQVKDYVAGKWGRYLRAPDLYFELFGLAPLGETNSLDTVERSLVFDGQRRSFRA